MRTSIGEREHNCSNIYSPSGAFMFFVFCFASASSFCCFATLLEKRCYLNVAGEVQDENTGRPIGKTTKAMSNNGCKVSSNTSIDDRVKLQEQTESICCRSDV